MATKPKRTKDWRRTIGMFTDNQEMKQLFQEALRIREKNRQQARRRLKKARSDKS